MIISPSMVAYKSTVDRMRNANKCPKFPYSAKAKKMKKWSGIQMRIRIAAKSKSLLEGNPLPMPAKFGRRPFPRSSVILFTEWQRMTERSHNLRIVSLLAEVIIIIIIFFFEMGYRPTIVWPFRNKNYTVFKLLFRRTILPYVTFALYVVANPPVVCLSVCLSFVCNVGAQCISILLTGLNFSAIFCTV